MTRINGPRIVLGGLLAGVVINTFEFVTSFFLLNDKWVGARVPDSAASLPMTELDIAALNLWGFLVGLLAIWLYASIRDTYGRGPKTAVTAGTVVWALAVFLVVFRPSVGLRLPITADVIAAGVGWVEITLGTLLGARQYRVQMDRVTTSPAMRV